MMKADFRGAKSQEVNCGWYLGRVQRPRNERYAWNMIDAISGETLAFFNPLRLHLHNGDGTAVPMSQWPLFTG